MLKLIFSDQHQLSQFLLPSLPDFKRRPDYVQRLPCSPMRC